MRRRTLPVAFVASVALVAAAACTESERAQPQRTVDPSSERRLAQGVVVGTALGDRAHGWLGLPYARPPIGALRWQAPQPVASGEARIEATQFGAACPQPSGPMLPGWQRTEDGEAAGAEDCLTLNVFAPRFAPAEVPAGGDRLPVMVWIHGGGNAIGSSAFYEDVYRLAEAHDVVVVSTNYRLGGLGWFHHPALQADDATAADRSGNYGTLDLIQALTWVRDNIGAFGGDPGNVTVFGESAGGINIFSLLVSPRSEGLFHKAIIQSGLPFSVSPEIAWLPADAPRPGRPNSASEVLYRLLVQDGRASDRLDAKRVVGDMSEEAVRNFLRSRTPEELLGAYPDAPFGMYPFPNVIRDGVVLPSEPFLARLREPEGHHRVPVVLGSNRDEFKLFMVMDDRFTRRFLGIPRVRDEAVYDRVAQVMSSTWRAVGVDLPADRLAASQPAPVFRYRFDWDEGPDNLLVDLGELLGAAHGMELTVLFLDFDDNAFHMATEGNLPGRRYVGEAMAAYWTNFARTGRPARGGTGSLPRWTATPTGFLVFDTPSDGGIRMAKGQASVEAVARGVLQDGAVLDRDGRCRLLAGQYSFLVASGLRRYDGFDAFTRGRCRGFDPASVQIIHGK